MDYKEIQELIKLVKKNKISELEIERDDFKIFIRSEGKEQVIVQQPQQPVMQQPVMQAQQPAQPTAASTPQPQEQAPQATAEQAQNSNLVEITSPMIGTFYRAPGPDKDPYVSIGDSISVGNTICMIEAMKLFNEIEAEQAGKIVKILVEDATPVEFGQPLFLIDPKA